MKTFLSGCGFIMVLLTEINFSYISKVMLCLNIRIQEAISYLFCRNVCLLGMEAIYKDGKAVGYVRRADYAFYIDKPIAYG